MLHPAISGIVALAEALVAPRRIWLFGSRAKGTHTPRSDIDLGFELGDRAKWSLLAATVEEKARALVAVDLVDIDRCSSDLRARILSEGKLIYERRD